MIISQVNFFLICIWYTYKSLKLVLACNAKMAMFWPLRINSILRAPVNWNTLSVELGLVLQEKKIKVHIHFLLSFLEKNSFFFDLLDAADQNFTLYCPQMDNLFQRTKSWTNLVKKLAYF